MRYAVQVSDRRLSINGKSADDEASKQTIVWFPDARFIAGLTGLARVPGFETQQWLLEALVNSGRDDTRAYPVLHKLRREASACFASHPTLLSIPRSQRRVTVMFTGYGRSEAGPDPAGFLLTNFQDFDRGEDDADAWEEFKLKELRYRHDGTDPITYIQRIGAWGFVREEQEVPSIRRLLEEDRPPEAVVGKLVDIIRTAAEKSTTIGKQLMSTILPADFTAGAYSEYHSTEAKNITYLADTVEFDSAPGSGRATKFLFIKKESQDGDYLVKPKQRPNDRCGCGSGEKYKRCHGRGLGRAARRSKFKPR